MIKKVYFDLSTLSLPAGTRCISAKAKADDYFDSDESNIESYLVGTEGLAYTLSDDGRYYICTGIGTATDADIFIASEIDGIPVTTIGDYAFNSCSIITSVRIPDSVTKIGVRAFSFCDGLAYVEIPDSVTEIGDYAFRECPNLESAKIGNNVSLIGDCAFYWCTMLKSVEIGAGVTTIGTDAFSFCSELEEIIYNGTTDMWRKIETKPNDWKQGVRATYVTCTDGTVLI